MDHTVTWHEEIVLPPRVPSYGVVPGEAKFKKEAGLASWLLSAAPAKSGPLYFPSEKRFLLFFAHEKGLGHMFQK